MLYNCHIHTFRGDDIPREFLPLGLVRILASRAGFRVIGRILNYLNPFSSDDLFDRYVRFVKIGRLESQQKIFELCRKFYPVNSKFFVLSMDMEYMGAGKVPRSYADQLRELAEMKTAYPDLIFPFVHVDPRRPGMMELVKKCFEEWGFTGIKIYPSLGYFPYDDDLDPVYHYAQNNNLPVIAHASPYNPVHYKGSKRKLKALLAKAKTEIDLSSNKRKKLCSNFAHPDNYKLVFEKFPNLRICLAHFGSDYFWQKFLDEPDCTGNWFTLIRERISEYPNLYTDISFTLHNKEFFPLLKVLMAEPLLKKRILLGSDYYMVETKTNERRFGIELRALLGEEGFKIISVDNPVAFLTGTVNAPI
ncbi:MAG: amidohydrolase family protein [Bacteroidales bacterium]|nr:amidohydrolase family protein [Bacteroidales bacterium]